MFSGRKLLIATKHRKEVAIAPVLEQLLGVRCFVPEDFDTDIFGTFTGEVQRRDDPITTVRNKCKAAMEKYGCDLGVASEGSFGPHPSLFFVPADDEYLIFMDAANKLEITARELTTETNFSGMPIATWYALFRFAENAGFPTHALVLKNNEGTALEVRKGIADWQTLYHTFTHFISQYGSVYVETDMRALYNPTRMQVIRRASEKLAAKISTRCPACAAPGFGVVKTITGLSCRLCANATSLPRAFVHECGKCGYDEQSTEGIGPNADPMYCDLCNP